MSACQICGAAPAPFGQGWPGYPHEQPEALRGKRLRLCAFGGACHAMAIARAIRAAGREWPGYGPGAPPPEAVASALAELGFNEAKVRRQARATRLRGGRCDG